MAKFSESDLEQLKSKDILTVFDHYGIKYTQRGASCWCCCPLHNEKTPSMRITPDTGMWYCFGCQKGGDAIAFIKEYNHMDFNEAVEELARIHHFELTKPEAIDPREEDKRRERRALIELNKAAMLWFVGQLNQKMHEKAKKYVLGRWSEESVEKWQIGYAPKDGTWLFNDLLKQGWTVDALLNSSLFKRDGKDKPYCTFSGRVMLPVFNNIGEPVGFCGRYDPTQPVVKDADGKVKEYPKYLNTDNDAVYNKSNIFFGWNFARKSIAASHEAVIVEGNPDVIKMHQLGVTNVIAGCGTALAKGHIAMLKKVCTSVVLLYDNDHAGQQAIERNGRKLLEEGMNPYALSIPDDNNGLKQDPDTFFESKEHYEQFSKTAKKHYILWFAERIKENFRDATEVASYMAKVCELLVLLPEPDALGYLNELAKIVPDKTTWTAAYNDCRKRHNVIDTKARFGFTEEQDSTLQRYGFLVDNNSYFVFKGNSEHGAPKEVSNFVLEPLFMICSSVNAKRIFRMTNCFGYTVDLEITQKDFGSRQSFRCAVGSRGNFRFVGKDDDLDKIVAYLMDNTKNCNQIDQLGWQPKGRFWAWSNGIFTPSGQFIPVDEAGTVQYEDQWYYLPACSSTTKDDKEFYQFERRFQYKASDADLLEWSQKFINAYGDNAIIGISYAIACMYRDVAATKLNSFPLLCLFGQMRTGKTKFALSLLRLFGSSVEGPSLESGTKAAIGDHMSKMYNGFVHLDEYKNNLSPEIIGMLKGAYDSRGRLKMDMDRDKKRMQTSMDCGLIISGQEKPTVDPALFSRTVYLTFERNSFTEEEEKVFRELKDYEEGHSLTPITHHILSKRPYVEDAFYAAYKEVKEVLRQQIGLPKVDGRILESYATILSYIKILDSRLAIPFTYSQALPIFAKYVARHLSEIRSENEMSDFWHALQSMLFHRDINLGFDLRIIKSKTDIKCSKGYGKDSSDINYAGPIDVLYLNPDPIMSAYMKHAKQHRSNSANIIPKTSLLSYLTAQEEYMGTFPTTFTLPRDLRDAAPKENGQIYTMRARALVFNYRTLKDSYGIDFDVCPMQTEITSASDASNIPY